jgi:non-ribosomal peptide synthetase component E (peptide arylation enzyme)
MISLPAIEEALAQKWPPGEKEPLVAVTAIEKDDGSRPVICLFSSATIDAEEANQVLRAAGISNLARIGEVIKVDQIPLLGSGKVDIQKLNEHLLQRGQG